MILNRSLLALVGGSMLLLGAAEADDRGRPKIAQARLSGYQEVASLSTPAQGRFFAIIDEKAGTLSYRISYSGFPTPVLQSHLHLGQRHTNGGVSAFICSNLGNGPAGTPTCPESSGAVEGTISAAAVVGPAAQGIGAGEFAELVAAIRSGAVYVNVHTQAFPAGEIRGQLR
jgi:hypothetical protein